LVIFFAFAAGFFFGVGSSESLSSFFFFGAAIFFDTIGFALGFFSYNRLE
jgi:hypothetical protein